MIFHRLGLIHKNQRGFTLIGLLVAIAITGLITGGLTTTIFQVFTVNALTSNHMTAVRQVQNAGYWISHDAQMAQSVDTNDDMVPPEEVLTLAWDLTEYGGTEHQVIYTLVGNELKRAHYTNSSLDATTIVAQYIDSIEVVPRPFAGGKLTLTVTASLSGWQPASETRIYEVVPRPDEVY